MAAVYDDDRDCPRCRMSLAGTFIHQEIPKGCIDVYSTVDGVNIAVRDLPSPTSQGIDLFQFDNALAALMKVKELMRRLG